MDVEKFDIPLALYININLEKIYFKKVYINTTAF